MIKKPKSILIRLIDVVLILLFGFISISQIEEASRVELPISSETKLSTPDTENLISVAIYQFPSGEWGYLVDNETKQIRSLDGLHLYLRTKKNYFKREARVKIYSEGKAPMKYVMQVADLCQQIDLKKSIIVKLKTRQSGLNTEL